MRVKQTVGIALLISLYMGISTYVGEPNWVFDMLAMSAVIIIFSISDENKK